jgi:hypothetical protein
MGPENGERQRASRAEYASRQPLLLARIPAFLLLLLRRKVLQQLLDGFRDVLWPFVRLGIRIDCFGHSPFPFPNQSFVCRVVHVQIELVHCCWDPIAVW